MPRRKRSRAQAGAKETKSSKRRRLDVEEAKEPEPEIDPCELLSKELKNLLVNRSQDTTTAYFCVSGIASCPKLHHLGLSCDFSFEDESFLQTVADAADDAPLGVGTETVVDHSRRLCKQLTNDKFIVLSPEWLANTSHSNSTLEVIRQTLAPHAPFIMAQLHKINVYPPGGFFKPHTDTWRSDRHIGSLVVFLPTKYEGGEFSVEHQNKRKEFSPSDWTAMEGSCHWMAFYADCPHEVQPVSNGFRMTLTYHLYLPPNVERPGERERSPEPSSMSEAVGRVLRMYGETPKSVVFPLAHRYVFSSISPSSLKGTDRLLYSSLSEHFGLKFSCVASSIAEIGYDDEGMSDEVYDEGEGDPPCLVQLCKPDFNPGPMTGIDHPTDIQYGQEMEHEESARDLIVNPREFIERSELLDRQIQGTGNEGCSIHTQYRGVGLVVFRREDAEEFRTDKNPPVARSRRGPFGMF